MAKVRWGSTGEASVLVGGQFGSEGKGLFSAWLAHQINPDNGRIIATANAGAQAGHTTQYAGGRKFICFHLPTTGPALYHADTGKYPNVNATSYINAGAIIDLEALEAELKSVDYPEALVTIHPRAAVITDKNKSDERDAGSSTTKLASTQKGVGAAIADKVMRRAVLAQDVVGLANYFQIEALDLNRYLSRGRSVVVEVPQGTGLSLNHGGEYPYVTSRDAYVGSGISDAGVHPKFVGPIAMVVRTFPIRVGNIYNELGEKLGSSGPFWGGSLELDWARDFPDIEPERTTVTKRVRRIATWSDAQYAHALSLNRPTIVCLNFVNYFQNAKALHDLVVRMDSVESRMGVRPRTVYGFGPNVEDVTDDFDRAVSWFDKRSF